MDKKNEEREKKMKNSTLNLKIWYMFESISTNSEQKYDEIFRSIGKREREEIRRNMKKWNSEMHEKEIEKRC